MWIVRLALRNPYSVGVLALFLLIMGVLSIATLLTDIFPVIDIPVVSVIWNYPGLTAEEMETRVVIINERAFSTTVQGVSHIESQSLPGIGNLRVYFERGTDIGSAVAQTTAVCETILRIMPPGITPPAILPFNAASVPVAQIVLSGDSNVPEQDLFDYGLNFLRVRLFTIPGLATPAPYGGANREINVDVDPVLAAAKGVSPQDVSTTLQNENIIEPAGLARIGKFEYNILTNASPTRLEEFRQFPIKVVNGREVRLDEVARVYDGHADQTNVVRINGKRSAYLNILKKAQSSTLTVVDSIKNMLPSLQGEAPKGIHLKLAFDQSTFVREAVKGVLEEGVIAAVLVSLMILVFLGSLKSVIIVCTSIPLSILASIIGLKLTGNTMNIMTLGGLALSIGMLVDDATVEIENINRNRSISDNITHAILRGARQIALPAIVTTLAICIVFFPVVLLTGPARFLFTPLSEAVVFAMIFSYILSRTLVPVLARILLRNAPMERHLDEGQTASRGARNAPEYGDTKMGRFSRRFNERRERSLDRLRDGYGHWLEGCLAHPWLTLACSVVFFCLTLYLPYAVIGEDFFPSTDAGIMKLHFRAPVGSRIEETERIVAQAEEHIRRIVPANELDTINSMIGVPTFYNIAFVPSDNSESMDAEMLIALAEKHQPTATYRRKIRADFDASFPGSVIYFEPADIVSQVLNFGLTAPIDIQFESRNTEQAYGFARTLRDKMRLIPGAHDAVIRQVLDYPSLRLDLDRERAAQLGLTARDATSSLLFSLTGSGLVAPSFYINPENNVNYQVVTKVPIPEISTLDQVLRVPVTPSGGGPIAQQASNLPADLYPAPLAQSTGNLGRVQPVTTMSQINHVDVQRVIDVLANVEGRDLGGVAGDIQKAINELGKLPQGLRIHLRGQNEVMHDSFTKLGLGMILAAALVYLLMVTLFQSWMDPLIIMAAVPGSVCGILWVLALTGTTINVEALMGTIMAIGIAVSNSNLMVNFANDFRVELDEKKGAAAAEFEGKKGPPPQGGTERAEGADASGVRGYNEARRAALEAGRVRLRPVLMTAIAMVLGMIPMATGLSAAGAQNAPLGRAVIGGLIFSTLATLFVVPVAYSVLRRRKPTKHELRRLYHQEEVPFDEELKREAARELRKKPSPGREARPRAA